MTEQRHVQQVECERNGTKAEQQMMETLLSEKASLELTLNDIMQDKVALQNHLESIRGELKDVETREKKNEVFINELWGKIHTAIIDYMKSVVLE